MQKLEITRSVRISEKAYIRLLENKNATGIPITRQIDNLVLNKKNKKNKGE